MSGYIFELAESKTRSRVGELTAAVDKQLSLVVNKAGTLTFRMPLTDPLASEISEVSSCVRVRRALPSGEIATEWEGPVWTIDEETPDSLSIGCVGWLQVLEKRVLWPSWSLSYASRDAGDIALDLLRQSNSDVRYSDTNFVVPGSYDPTQARTRTYSPWSGLLSEIQALSDIEGGFDMEVDPVTRELDIFERVGALRPDLVFEYDGNVVKARRSSDASRICNRMVAYSSVGYALAEDLDSQSDVGRMEEAVALSDVVDVGILQAYANAEVAVRSRALRQVGLDPRKTSSARPDDARPLEHFRVGDVGFYRVQRGRLDEPALKPVRLFGFTISWDSAGQTQVSGIQTTASSGT